MVTSNIFLNSFKQAVKSATECDDKKLVIILGSGFHRQYLNGITDANQFSCLNKLYDWQKLLETVYDNYPHSGHYLKDFEDIIIKSARGDNPKINGPSENLIASEIEDQCLKCIQSELAEAQEMVVKYYHNGVPLWLFNSKIVSDVISLNFDLIPETLLSKRKRPPRIQLKDEPGFKEDVNIARHRAVNGIRFWHPHGDIASYKSIILSLRKYANLLQQVESLRKNFKAFNEKQRKYEAFTWYTALTVRPVLVVGASISQLEWDLWFALANRRRNFAKPDNKKHELPIFKMTGPCETLDKNWFSELTIRKETYPSQWKHLQDLFNKY